MKPLLWILVFFSAAPLVVGCGSSSSSSQPSDDSGSTANDAGTDAAPTTDAPTDETSSNDADESGPSDVYPAAHPPLPTAKSKGGAVVAHPKIVPVVFDSDPLAHDIETFMGAFAGTTYWQTVLADYGIDKPITFPVAHVGETLASTIDDSDIQTWLAAHVDGTHDGFPVPDADTLYALFYPPGVTITYGGLGSSCSAFHGYHGSAATPSGVNAVYSVISRCASIPEDTTLTGIQYVSAVTSHEVVEGLTDPFITSTSTAAFALVDDAHVAWELYPGGEVGDLCALVGDAFIKPADFPYAVQRIWSNTAAASGHDPCIVQQPGKTYFNSAPVLDDDVRVYDNFGTAKTTKGVKIAIGESKTIEVDLFSDAPTDAWTVSAVEPFSTTSHHLQLSWDRTTGKNGDKLHLTITALSKDPQFGGEFFMILSKLGTQRTFWSVFVNQA